MNKKLLALCLATIMTFGSCSSALAASGASAAQVAKVTSLGTKCIHAIASFNPVVDGTIAVGQNLVGVANGEKKLGEAAVDTAIDVAIAAGIGEVASTSAGSAAIGTAAALGSTAIATVAPFAVPVVLLIGSSRLVKRILD
ncbi:MAG: hypothetical protein Q4D21_03165 [Phascolarctobacterium sp.]|nr:hypothetical protein [Phascolarctobacterium sp.]